MFDQQAPEIFKNQGKKYYKSVDLWSFGVVIHEVVTGHRPFLGAPNEEDRFSEYISKKKNEDIRDYIDDEG